MVTLYDLKPRFQALLRPLAARLADQGVTANQVTVVAAVGSVLLGGMIAGNGDQRWLFLLIPVWCLNRMGLNALDGVLAREFNQKSALGAYLNEILDIVSDAALYAPFALAAPFDPVWIAAVIFLSALSEFSGVLGSTIGASRRYDGPMGKSDRALAFGALGLTVGLTTALPSWVAWILPVLAALLCVTIVNRIRGGLAEKTDAPSTDSDPR